MTALIFYFFAGLAVASAFSVILLPKPTRALIALIVMMASLAVIFLLLGAYFVAVAHLIVYAGAVLVLFLFVIMLQGTGARDIPLAKRFHPAFPVAAGLACAAFLFLAVRLMTRYSLPQPAGVQGTVQAVARVLFRDYLLDFELISFFLILGVLAAVALAKKEPS